MTGERSMTLNGPFMRRARAVEHVARHGFLRLRHLAPTSAAEAVTDELGVEVPGAAPRRSLGRPDSAPVPKKPKEQSHVTTSRLRMG